MDKELKILLDNHKLDQLYKNNLFSIKSICELLGTWDQYSLEEKFKLENITARDSRINKHFTYKGDYNDTLVYSEILRSGVDTIISKINKYKKPTEKDVFVDVGSGCGKLILHTAISSNIKTLVGVELLNQRYNYAKYIKEMILPESNSVFFINKNIKDFDLSVATIVFINDVCFENRLTLDIYEALPKGCHFILSTKIDSCKIMKEEFNVDVSWGGQLKLYYYIK
jgi:hypothetical protein